jgi:hypothetical protein
MSCPHITAFLSCSFRSEDKEVNDYFKAICEGLNVTCKNVSDGYASTPPEVARKMIQDCKIVLAVIPKREQTTSGKWTMPSAVHEEMAMAYALKKPTLIVIEDGVTCDGFLANLGTYKTFERTSLHTNDFVKTIVSSIHGLRLQAVEQNNLLPDQDAAGFFADRVSFLCELTKDAGRPVWNYHSTRKLVFTRPLEGQLKQGSWVDYIPEGATEKIRYELKCTSNSGPVDPIVQLIRDTPQQIELGIEFAVRPQKDDWIEIEFFSASQYFNWLSKADVQDQERPVIGGKAFDCIEGLIPIQPTREMHIQIRFPGWYSIDKCSIFPFVGSYSGGIDYLAESEIKRCNIEVTKFGTNTQVDIKVESPLMRHIYGVAWNLV